MLKTNLMMSAMQKSQVGLTKNSYQVNWFSRITRHINVCPHKKISSEGLNNNDYVLGNHDLI